MTELVFDLETHLFERGRLAPRIVCASLKLDNAPAEPFVRVDAVPRILAHLRAGGTFRNAFLAFDFSCICADQGEAVTREVLRAYREGRIRDVLLDAKILDIAHGRYEHIEKTGGGWSLQALAERRGVKMNKDAWRLHYSKLDSIPIEYYPEGARTYVCDDAEEAYEQGRLQDEAAAQFEAQHRVNPLRGHSQRAARHSFSLYLASCWGIPTDRERTLQFKQRVTQQIDVCKRRMQMAKLVREDGTCDMRAAQRYMIDVCVKRGIEVPMTDNAERVAKMLEERSALVTERTAMGELGPRVGRKLPAGWKRARELDKKLETTYSLRKGHLVACVKLDRDVCITSGSRVLELLGEYGAAGDLMSRVDRLKQGFELPLQTRFDAMKVTTRTSSTLPMEPIVGEQMQNFPRSSAVSAAERKRERDGEFFVGVRECFTPRRPDWCFIGADLSMFELHTLAELNHKLFGYSEMGRLLNQGVDLHYHFAARTLRMSYEAVVAGKRKRDRNRAKPANFGFPGGMGPDKFILYSRKGYGVRFERDEVVALKAQWLETFPEMREYFDWINFQLGGRTTFTHVHPITGFVRGGCWYTSGSNHGFQHLAAYGAKDAFSDVTDACFEPESPLYGFRPWDFIHDEVLAEGPTDRAPAAVKELGRLFAAGANKWLPNYPTTSEAWMARIYSKQTEPTYNESGDPILWMPEIEQAA